MDFAPPCDIFCDGPEFDFDEIENIEPVVQKKVQINTECGPAGLHVPLDKYSGTSGPT